MIQDARGNIDYAEKGSGPTVVLVPGSRGARSAWRAVITALDGRFRFVTTSLLGYGGTAERRSEGDISIDHEADIIETVIHRAGDAVHLVGHSYGTLACLTVAIRRAAPLTSLCVIEPTGVNLLRRNGEVALYEQISVVRDYIVATTATNILDWLSNGDMDLPLEAYSAITVPSLIIRGGRGHPYVTRISEILSSAMPNAALASVAGAAHSMMVTHAAELAAPVGEHISKAEAQSDRPTN